MQPNPFFKEAQQIAKEFKELSPSLINLKKDNKIAIYFSNESLSALSYFSFSDNIDYNVLINEMYETLYKMNYECDFVDHTVEDLSQYKLIVVPALYVASDIELKRLNDFVAAGGNVLYTFKSGYCNENVQVRMDKQPALIADACGFTYQLNSLIDSVRIKCNAFEVSPQNNYMHEFIELLTPTTAEVWATYDNPYWGEYAAITYNKFGKGSVAYIAGHPTMEVMKQTISKYAGLCGLHTDDNDVSFPVIIRKGTNEKGKTVRYYLNYSPAPVTVNYAHGKAKELFSGKNINKGDSFTINRWDLAIFEE